MSPARRRLLVLFVSVLLVGTAGTITFRRAGAWLLVSDPLQPARAIVVLGGEVPFRAIEAAALYDAGWAPDVWVTQGVPTEDDDAMTELGIEMPSGHGYSVKVLERLGVPAAHVRVLDDHDLNTVAEMKTVAQVLPSPDDRVILVTSKYHARRVRMLWRRSFGSTPSAIVRYATKDPFDPRHWWRTTTDAAFVVREWFGLINTWAGFPVASMRDHSSK